jgi:hypothetical protein
MHYLEIHSIEQRKSLPRLPSACEETRHCGASLVFVLY